MYVLEWICALEYRYCRGQKRAPDPFELELQVLVICLLWVLVICLLWVLGTKTRILCKSNMSSQLKNHLNGFETGTL